MIHCEVTEHGIIGAITPAATRVRQEMVDGDLFDAPAVRQLPVVRAEDAALPKN